MSQEYIKSVATKIYQSCITLFEERVVSDVLKQDLLLQLKQYYEDIEPKDERYLRSLQFMFENWSNTLPKKEEPPKVREPIYFFKPRGEFFPPKTPAKEGERKG